MKRSSLIGVGLLGVAVLLATGLSFTSSPGAKHRPKKGTPTVAWTPESLVVTLSPGETKTLEASAQIKGEFSGIRVEVAPMLRQYVTVTPDRLRPVNDDDDDGHGGGALEQIFEIAVTIPEGTAFGTIDGAVQLVFEQKSHDNDDDDGHGDDGDDVDHARGGNELSAGSSSQPAWIESTPGRIHRGGGGDDGRPASPNHALARSLPITLNMWPRLEGGGIEFIYPAEILAAGGHVGEPVVTPRVPGVVFLDVSISVDGDVPSSALGFLIHENLQGLSLEQWFTQTIDPGGLLVAAGTFILESFEDGRVAYVSRGAVPPEYEGPPLAYAYVLSPTRHRIVSYTLSHDNELHRLGYSSQDSREVFLRIVLDNLIITE